MIAAVKTQSLLGEKKSLESYPGKIENKGLAAVVTGEGPGLKRTTVVAADECTILLSKYFEKKENWRGAAKHDKWELESKPRGRQEIQNGRNTPANSIDGTVITTEKCL